MKLLAILLCLLILALPASALEVEAPTVPEMGKQWMPHNTQSLAEGLLELVQKGILSLRPDLKEASRVSLGILAAVLMICTVQSVSAAVKNTAELAGTVAVAAMLLLSTKSMIRLAADTILEIGAYGKLLLPVMTTALAAQGGISGSAALYAGTALFSSILQSAMNHVLIPGIYLYLALGTGSSATGESLLKKMAQTLKAFLGWLLKGILGVFTTYLALTGVVSGTTDAAALKAAKVTMSTVIPVVGSVLSDASEAVLVSAGLMKKCSWDLWNSGNTGTFFTSFPENWCAVPDSKGNSGHLFRLWKQQSNRTGGSLQRWLGASAGHDGFCLCHGVYQHRVLYERSQLMQALGRYVLTLTTSVMICGILLSLLPKGRTRTILQAVCGIFLAASALSPVLDLSIPDVSALPSEYLLAGEAFAQTGEEEARRETHQRIKQGLEAYILDKAEAYQAQITADVTLTQDGLPESVTYTGAPSDEIRQLLENMVTEDLGIPKENQRWSG